MDIDPRLHFYSAYTLVDITETNNRFSNKDDPLNKSRSQQRNWESVLQVLGLRAQPLEFDGPHKVTVNMREYDFGKNHKGAQTVWSWSWAIEYEDLYAIGDNKLFLLEQDFTQVPIIVGLDESAKFTKPLFYTEGPEKNIYFKLGKY